LEPAALGLPEREYYIQDDEKTLAIRSRYKKYVNNMLRANEDYEIVATAEVDNRILQLETELATNMMVKEDRRDIGKLYNPMNYLTLKEKYGAWDWDLFLSAAEIPTPEQIIVTDLAYFDFFNSFISSCEIETI